MNTFVAEGPEIPRCARDKLNDIQTTLTVADRQLAFWLFLLTFVTYAYFQAGGGWNQNSQFDLTRAIVEQHTFAIDAYASNTGDVSRAGGHVYSNKSPALSWIAAIPYAALYAANGGRSIEAIILNTYILTLICVALPGALIPWSRRFMAQSRAVASTISHPRSASSRRNLFSSGSRSADFIRS